MEIPNLKNRGKDKNNDALLGSQYKDCIHLNNSNENQLVESELWEEGRGVEWRRLSKG